MNSNYKDMYEELLCKHTCLADKYSEEKKELEATKEDYQVVTKTANELKAENDELKKVIISLAKMIG